MARCFLLSSNGRTSFSMATKNFSTSSRRTPTSAFFSNSSHAISLCTYITSFLIPAPSDSQFRPKQYCVYLTDLPLDVSLRFSYTLSADSATIEHLKKGDNNLPNCNVCGKALRTNAKFCTYCGATTNPIKQENICLNPNCKLHISKFQFDFDEMRCSECGSFTTIGKKIDDQI